MSEHNNDKSNRPFYELPSHFKPCSTIIKETRMQLQFPNKDFSNVVRRSSPISGSSEEFLSPETEKNSSPIGSFNKYAQSGSSYSSSSISAPQHIRALQTKRPFTPRDSVNLWGISARKRPPSAITLSRLSLDEISESRPQLSAKMKNSSMDSLENETYMKNSYDVDNTQRKLKLLSLSLSEGESANQDSEETEVCANLNTSGKEFYSQINHLEVAIEYLEFVVQNSCKKAQQTPKEDIIGILRGININIVNINGKEKLKSRLLKLLFKLVENNQNDEDILFWSSFILLHCQITGNNLTTVYKMIFKASKSKDYLLTIKESGYLRIFLNSFSQVHSVKQIETLIYGYGILKFICNEEEVLEYILGLNLIDIMFTHLSSLNQQFESGKKAATENIQNGIFQLTSILRNIVGINSVIENVANSGLLKEVINSLSYTVQDGDVLSNIMRILSVISENDACGEVIVDNPKFCGAVGNILQTWHSNEDIVVRLVYSLGNVLGKYEDMRIKFYNEPISYQMIIQLICYYMECGSALSEDILVKSIRLLANWSLEPAIGAEFSEDVKLNEILLILLRSKDITSELLLCTIATLNNITYYKDFNMLDDISANIAEEILGYVTFEDIEIRSETIKVLGNLSRNVDVRKTCANHIEELLLSLRESKENLDLLCAAIGVLINVIADDDCKKEFLEKQGLDSIMKLISRTHNIRLALMITQLLWNLILSVANTFDSEGNEQSYFQDEEIRELSRLIATKMDEFGMENGSSNTQDIYNDFLTISSSLYEKLNSI